MLDISLSQSVKSFASTNSQGLKRCMIVRTKQDELNEEKLMQYKKMYEERKKERLQNIGRKKLQVSFGKIEIREYPIILGYNPAVSKVRNKNRYLVHFIFVYRLIHFFVLSAI